MLWPPSVWFDLTPGCTDPDVCALASACACRERAQVTAGKFAPLLKQTLSEDAWGSLVEEPGAAMDSDMWEMFIGAVRERELEALNDRQVSASVSLL